MTSLEKNIRFSLGQFIGNRSWLHWINYHRKMYEGILVYEDTDICIEGFQRSGNTFFLQLLKRKNPSLKFAHHMHVPEQVKRAVSGKVPTVILIRKPQDCIASLLAWDERLSIGVGLTAYQRFYRSLMDYRHGFVIARFEDVIEKPKAIVTRINKKFDADFVMHVKDDVQLSKILGRVSNRTKNTLSAPVPNQRKEEIKKKYKEEILRHPTFEKTAQTYHQFLNES